ncbi:MAG: class I SAM-dependent rRNA methyltransferase [Bacteroidales bacterium]|nr:class I SAM-dependent rRNA methyltransferase [Bacteroidales bacterium]
MTKLYLKKGREESLRRFHPWVFSGAVGDIEGPDPAEGDAVAVYSSAKEILGWGHFQIGSIAVRMLSFTDDMPAGGPDTAFWTERLQGCLDARRAFGLADAAATNCYRLVHGEGDGLPGLIVDWYDGVCVMQAHSAGMFRAKEQISKALQAVYGRSLRAVYDKSSGTAPFKANLDLGDGYLYQAGGAASLCPNTVLENGHRFLVDWETGQKTGFFLDQRENRSLVERYAAGRRVLNLFCYTGGFSVYALAGGAVSVDSVDSSARAIELVEQNVTLNFGPSSPHRALCCDAIDFVKAAPKDAYDLMIVDPPAFAKHRGALANALRAYQRLNAAAIDAVAPGGLVFTFSCSQVVDREAFALAVFSAAAQTGRRVRIIDRLGQPADHAVNIYHPEGAYLKGLVLYVE